MRRRFFVAALAVVLSFTGHLPAQLVFDDGGDHTLTGNVNDAVYVSNQSHLTIDANGLDANLYVNNATVDHLNGEWRNNRRVTISNHSVFNSHVQGEVSYDAVDSEVNFYAGHSAMSQSILAGGTSIVRLLDGRYVDVLRETISLRGDAQIFVSAKSQVRIPIVMRGSSHGQATNALIASLNLSGSASFDVQGGILRDTNWDDNWRDRSLRLFDDAKFTMTGGTIDSFEDYGGAVIETHQRSQVVLRDVRMTDRSGGFSRHLDAMDTSTITLHGSGFNYPLGPVGDLEGFITGFLSDGSPMGWSFLRQSTAHIVLVPKPSAGLLFLGGSGLLAVRRRCGGSRRAAAI